MLRYLLITMTMACSCTVLSAQTFLKKFNTVSSITAVGNSIFFVADDGVHGNELWITDGTSEGTHLVKDIYPGFIGSEPSYLINFNGELYFAANTLQFGKELWKSDGTSAGTVLVKDIYSGDGQGADPRALTIYNNNLYFDASPDGFNRSVYKSNGTSVGTLLLKDMGFGEITDIAVAGNSLYYVFASGKLYHTNGTPAGTELIDVDAYTTIENLTTVESQLFFTTSSAQNANVRLYTIEGVNAPFLIKEYNAPGSGTNELANFTAVGSDLYFSVRNDYEQKEDELWISDGSVNGTKEVKAFSWDGSGYSAMKNFLSYNDILYFQNGSAESDAWWKSDGTTEGTVSVSLMRIGYPDLGTYPPVISDGKIYLSAEGELWVSDGTGGGTKELYDINQNYVSTPTGLKDVSGVLYFIANDGYGSSLWNIKPASEVDVVDPSGSSILSGGSLAYEPVSTGDCTLKTIDVKNVGAKELILADITVTGKDFFINGEVPSMLRPNEKVSINIYFVPFTTGDRTGSITIRTNDANESSYTIQLSGTANPGTSTTFCEAFDGGLLKKTLIADASSTIILSKNTILELQAIGTTIGNLSVGGGTGYTFTLVSGEGDGDNDQFTIDDDVLKSQAVFNYDSKNIFTIRIKAQNGTAEFESQLIVIVQNEVTNSLPASDCNPVTQRINAALLDVEFNSLGHLFACGDGGKLIRSTDGGLTWIEINSGVSNRLSRIVFNGTVGYAAGDGVLLKSEDNGANWFQLYVPEVHLTASTLFFLSAEVGFAASSSGEVLKTTDGGINWRIQGEIFGRELTSIFFWNEDEGIACTFEGAIFKTSNGGVDWIQIDSSTLGQNVFTSVTFIDNNKGYLLSLTNLFTTNDGGEHWNVVPSVSGTYLQGVTFVTNSIGYVMGGYSSNELFMTVNGGDTWDEVTVNPLTKATGVAYHPGNGQVVIVGTHTYDISSADPGNAILSSVAGTGVWDVKANLHTEDYVNVTFPSDAVGYVAGNEDVYKTINGGLTWKPLGLQKQIFGIAFTTDQVGYYADGFKIYSTANGGTTWTKKFEIPDTGPADLKHVITLSSSVVLAYSTNGKIYRTGDSGATWPLVFNQPVNSLQQIYFPTASVGYGVDQLGRVIKTSNGGVSWSVVYGPLTTGESFNTLYFFDANNGLMAGVNGVMYRTSNGGTSWTKVFSGISAGIKRIIFQDALIGYAFTDQGTIYKSADGGQSWDYFGVTSFIGLNDVSRSGNKIYYAGDYGNLGKIDLPKTPTQPGYISGDQIVCIGDAIDYSLASNPDQNYYWNIAGATLTANENRASVQFLDAGQYTLTAQLFNTCGTSTERTLSITVEDPPHPAILGPALVPANSSTQFDIENPAASSHYTWDVTGALSFSGSAQGVNVNWGTDPGSVSVIETAVSGCRAKITQMITIDPSTIVGVGDDNIVEAGVLVYPNPTSDQVLIESNLADELNVRVYNLMGQEYSVKSLQPFSNSSINMSGLPNGLYLLEISLGGKSKAIKRVLKN